MKILSTKLIADYKGGKELQYIVMFDGVKRYIKIPANTTPESAVNYLEKQLHGLLLDRFTVALKKQIGGAL